MKLIEANYDFFFQITNYNLKCLNNFKTQTKVKRDAIF